MSVQKAIEPVIRVTVKTITSFKQIVGAGEIELTIPPESVLQDVISHLVKRFGDRLASRFYKPGGTQVLPYIRLMVNGRDIAFLNGMETVLHDGDEVLILPPVSGG